MKNKRNIFIVFFIISVVCNILFAGYIAIDYYRNKRNKDIFKLNAYAWMNNELKQDSLPNQKRVVFIGNSITENWVHLRYKFFKENNYICRGIGGQTSPLLLLRFRQDVIDLHPKVVVINAGINDIAENTGEYDIDFTLGNIKSMAELARINKIEVVLTSILPCAGNGWKGHITDVPAKIKELNDKIKEYALDNDFYYLDYYSHMEASDGSFIKEYTFDGLHPNEEGYMIMEPFIKDVIDKKLSESDIN